MRTKPVSPTAPPKQISVDVSAFYWPEPKFSVGDIVRHGYGPEKGVVKIVSRSYVRGWYYGIQYRCNFGGSGGYCYSPSEIELRPLSDPVDKLKAQRMIREDRLQQLEWEKAKIGAEVSHLTFSIKAIEEPGQ